MLWAWHAVFLGESGHVTFARFCVKHEDVTTRHHKPEQILSSSNIIWLWDAVFLCESRYMSPSLSSVWNPKQRCRTPIHVIPEADIISYLMQDAELLGDSGDLQPLLGSVWNAKHCYPTLIFISRTRLCLLIEGWLQDAVFLNESGHMPLFAAFVWKAETWPAKYFYSSSHAAIWRALSVKKSWKSLLFHNLLAWCTNTGRRASLPKRPEGDQ